jgi:hypothetical protein
MHRIISLALIAASVALGSASTGPMSKPSHDNGAPLGEVTDIPAWSWMVWWTGTGEIGDFLVSNAIQGGIFSRASDDRHAYDCTFPETSVNLTDRGKTCEYPVGSKHYYLYANGIWFGALYPNVNGNDTAWKPNVSKAAYNSDFGAMSVPEMASAGGMGDISVVGLYFSDMVIAEGYTGAGDKLFVQPGQTPESYQVPWPFADTALNSKRPAGQKLDPAKGDMVSHEDTYAVGGDWIPDSDAVVIWVLSTGNYDGQGLGVRVEQRTYSWSTTALANAIVLNYKIRNMNDFTLKAPYFSYFMDPDIGTGGSKPGDEGGWDDLTGFDKSRNLGYAYDSDGSESGWTPAPAYVGVVLLEAPGNKGMTGFKCWENDTMAVVDNLGEDSIKYVYMTSTDFAGLTNPTDARLLLNSGPFPNMAPNAEYDFTVAVVLGPTLNELKANVDSVKAAFSKGFLPVAGVADRPASTEPLKLTVNETVSAGAIKLSYSLPASGSVSISLFDASGRKLSTLKQGQETQGSHVLSVGTSGLSSGVYFVRLETTGGSVTAKMLVLD